MKQLKLPLGVLGGVILVWSLWWALMPRSNARPGAGELGDWYNILSALFTGLAFGGVVLTLTAQREDIRQQAFWMRTSAQVACLPTLIERLEKQIDSNPMKRGQHSSSTRSIDELEQSCKDLTAELAKSEQTLVQRRQNARQAQGQPRELEKRQVVDSMETDRADLSNLITAYTNLILLRREMESLPESIRAASITLPGVTPSISGVVTSTSDGE